MSDTYYVVGVHGAPTPETAPHGVMWRSRHGDGSCSRWYYGEAPPNTLMAEWAPLPAPPTEQAPPPEPAKRWRVGASPGRTHARILLDNCDVMTCEDAEDAVYVLNTLDAHGVAWGPGRPMSELPESGAVLLLDDEGAFCVLPIETVRAWSVFVCWWPLPLPGEAQ